MFQGTLRKDLRMDYLLSRFKEFWAMGDKALEDKVDAAFAQYLTDSTDNWKLIQGFLQGTGSTYLLLYMQPEGSEPDDKIFVVDPSKDAIPNFKKRTIYMQRMATGKAISTKDTAQIIQDVQLGAVEANLLTSYKLYLTELVCPMLRRSNKWGNNSDSQKELFLERMQKYGESLKDLQAPAQGGKDTAVELIPPEEQYLKSAGGSNSKTKPSTDTKFLQPLQSAVEKWIETISTEIENVQVYSEDQQNVPETVGPMSELVFWRERNARLNRIIDQLQRPEMQKTIQILRENKQPIMQKWAQVGDSDLTEALSETKENVKYLSSLEKYFEILNTQSPRVVITMLPALMNSIKMMYTIARYYSSRERMTTIFIKITNQMIQGCKKTINPNSAQKNKLWEQASDPETLKKLLDDLQACLDLSFAYREEYESAKSALLAKNPKGKQFDFKELNIFGRFELFGKRISKLITVFKTVDQFKALENYNIDGMEGHITRFKDDLNNLKGKSNDLLDYTKPSFDRDYIEFTAKMTDLESSLQVFINSSFENITSTENALGLLKKFQAILHTDTLRSDLDSKYMVIFHNYGLDLENVQKLYERHKAAPPKVRNITLVAGAITWSKQLYRRIATPMRSFQTNKTIMNNQKESKKIIRTYNKVARALIEYETMYLNMWKQSIDNRKQGLSATLLHRHEGKLWVNFDPEILELIKETRALMRMGIQVPNSAKMVLMQEHKLKLYWNELNHFLKEYERVVGSGGERTTTKIIPVTRPIMQPNLDALDAVIRPGEYTLHWTSLNIEQYLHQVQSAVANIDSVVTKVNDIITNRIQANLKLVSSTLLVNLSENQSFSLEQFVSLQERHIKVQSAVMDIKNKEVETAADDVIQTILASQGDKAGRPEEKITALKMHFNRLMFKAILTTTTHSLNIIKKRVGTRNRIAFMFVDKPFFDVNVQLINQPPYVILHPSLDEVQKAINQSATAVLSCSKFMSPWNDMGENYTSFFEEIAKNKEIVKVVLLLTGGIHGLKKQVIEYLNHFSKYEPYWKLDKEVEYQRFVENSSGLEEFEEQLRKFVNLEKEIDCITHMYNIGSLSLNTEPLKKELKRESQEWKNQYAKNLHQTAAMDLEKVILQMEEDDKQLSQDISDNLEDLRLMMTTLRRIRERESEIDLIFEPVMEKYNLLKRYNVNVPKEEFDRVGDLRFKWRKLRTTAEKRTDEINLLQHGFKKDLTQAVQKFGADVIAFRNDYQSNGPMVKDIKPQEAMDRLRKYQRLFDDKERKWNTYAAGEELFGMVVHQYPELTRSKRELQLLDQLYTLYTTVDTRVKSYEELLWCELNFDNIIDEVAVFQNQCKRLPKSLREWDAYIQLKKILDNFEELKDTVKSLKHEAIRTRHWEAIMAITKTTWKLDPDSFKLQNILRANLLAYKDDVEDIAMSSVREADIERKYNDIVNTWKDVELTFQEFKHRGLIQLRGEDTATTKEAIEEASLVVGSMMTSRYSAFMRKDVQSLMTKLISVSETLGLWTEVQTAWAYLEAVFAGGDIMKQLPQEAKRFGMIDKAWVKIMNKANEQKNVLEFCYENELLAGLPGLREQLDDCQRKLSQYLEQKRNLFPRFYFVSDGVLLEILSQASDPASIRKHLCSIFDGVDDVTLIKVKPGKGDVQTQPYMAIVELISGEGQNMNLRNPVNCLGNVEDWLNALVDEMVASVREVARRMTGRVAGFQQNFMELGPFINESPSQISILALQMMWTADVTECITTKVRGKGAAQVCGTKIDQVKRWLVATTISPELEKAPKRMRTNIETLITIQVHQDEVFQQTLKKVTEITSFDWLKQARFYYRSEKDMCVTSIADSDTDYCYEYLGVKERLVITPLTDRCYITLSQALTMYLGGAPAGPAGTGKTETTKDLARTFGKLCVVFNCSDQMDRVALGKIIRGLCQSNAWGCFDEFNRIELPVLSVVAQQVQCVLSALKQHKTEFDFIDGQKTELQPGVGFFITMNPGYAGRQELPENLKVLFRGVTMMVPDRQAIMKVKLASQGYQKNEPLSLKFFVLYKLCEEQLSKQRHYDFGLRNILSVLRTAGQVLRKNPGKDEEFLFMRTLRDMNLSKLVFEDIDLFDALLADMFPGKTPDKSKHEDIEVHLPKVIKARGLIDWPGWTLKIIQLYETKLVRHGIMVVGPAMCGKSMIYGCMLDVLTKNTPIHQELRMNPKALTAGQMFGKLDASGDWQDGVFSSLWRKARDAAKKRNMWIVCDGPVDAIWIENLNTVLDDNKLLTLANGDRIQMTDTMKACFEVENLANASPATVSRAGIIFVSESVLGRKPVIEAYLQAVVGDDSKIRPTGVKKICMPALAQKILPLYQNLFGKVEAFYQKEVSVIMQTGTVHQAVNSFYYVVSLGDEVGSADLLSESVVEKIFWFSVSWAFGGMLESKERDKFDAFVRQNLRSLPEEGTIFDYKINVKTNQWENWKKFVTPWKYPGDDKLDFASLFIQTTDTVRVQYLLNATFQQRHSTLLMGVSGTAKTVVIEQFLSAQRTASQNTSEPQNLKKFNFSSMTTTQNFYDSLDECLEKQATAYGPKGGGRLTIFVDDINMPEINAWGDQVTNEIVRQAVEFSEVYDLSKGSAGIKKSIKNVQYVAAMSQPGGGKNDIPHRLKRHMVVLNCPLPEQEPIQQIFGSIFEGRYTSAKYKPPVVELAGKLTAMTIDFWRQIAKRMLPTPDKFHYFFNLRDLSSICEGMMKVGIIQDVERRSKSAAWESIKDDVTLLSLWRHECTRVFSDKLNEGKDKEWFDNNLHETVAKVLSREIAEATKEPVYFVNFLRQPEIDNETGEVKEAAQKVYEKSESVEQLQKVLYEFQKNFNLSSKIRKLDLVLFDAAVKHIVRLTRILSTSRGNALLVGVGGSGKQSLTRLASYVNEMDYAQIVVTKNFTLKMFFDAIREQYMQSATKKPVAFVFTDNEIKQEVFLEYINSFLASGEIAGLFGGDEKDAAVNEMRVIAKKDPYQKVAFQDTSDWLWRYFINRVRERLHFVLCFSPVGQKFRNRARKFPGLISCCYINWFLPWPEKALLSVSEKTIRNFQMDTDEKTKEGLQVLMAWIHSMMLTRSEEYFQRFRRYVYSTPKSYLSFIQSYTEVYKTKYMTINEDAKKIGNGLKKLHQAADDVRLMKGDLQQKEVKLMQAQRETDALVKEIEIRSAEAEKKRAEVEAVKEILSREAAIVAKGEAEAARDLEAAQPALDAAEGALDSIKPEDLSSLKPMLKPPPLVKRIFDGVLILLMRPLELVYIEEVKGGFWITDSWVKSGKPFISEMGALATLKSFGANKKDDINEETCELLLPYLWMEDFNADVAAKACGNVAGLCTWVRAMHTYINIAKIVGPKKELLRKSQADLRVANKKKEAKELELNAVNEEVAKYNAQFQAENAKKVALEEDANNCKRRMDNANGLIDALGGERQRWTEQSNEFKDLIRRLVGDVAMSCGFIAYCGPFNSEFRSALLNQHMISRCKQLKIPVTDNLSIVKFLVDDVTVGEWQLEGLPTDDHSIQNAIMITKSSKFPLMCDPQGQGLQWIKARSLKKMKELEKEKGDIGNVVISQLNDKQFGYQIVAQMANGHPMIIENIPEEIDPIIDPILEKQINRNSRIPKLMFNDTECDFNDRFELFLASKLPNPHFIPELYAKCTIIDFTVTMIGLEQQLLGQVVGREKSELNEESAKLAEEINDNERRLRTLQDNLLKQLSESQGNLIDDLTLIQTLQESKDASGEIKEKLSVANETRKRITAACEEYRDVAIRGSVLYFLIVEMSAVNVMYQTSLPQFLAIFDNSITKSERAQVTAKRINFIIEAMTWNSFAYIVRGLFSKHKLLFVLLMACKIQMRAGKLPAVAFNTFLKGGGAVANDKGKPFSWFKEKSWANCVGLSESVPRAFKQLLEIITRNEKQWKEWIDADAPEATPIPDLNDKIEPFDRLLVVRALREDRTTLAASDYVASTLGKAFAEPQQLDIEAVIEETNGITPIIFLLSQGSDPTATIETAAKKNRKKKVHPVSMGQGQEQAANDVVAHAFQSGDWALLQNCHLGLPFLLMLEETLRQTKLESVSPECRLWVTSEPHPLFPIGLLQASIKLTNEPPQGIKAGIIRSYSWLSQDQLDQYRRPEWKPLLFTQCMLHSIVQERRKFGPSGFCIPYEFNQGDWMASVQFLQNHLNILGEDAKKTSVSWETIRYMVSDIQYGGRITDNKDRELFMTITTALFDPRITLTEKDHGYTFCPREPRPDITSRYAVPPPASPANPQADEIGKHREFIRETFPDTDPPDVFGMHGNADITYRSIQTVEVLTTILDIQPRGGGDSGGISRTDVIKGMIDRYLKELPPKWKPDKKEKLGDRQPLSIFAGQEIDRLSKVVSTIRTTCIDLKDALDGKIIMSVTLQDAQDYLFDNRVPPSWVAVAWPAATVSGWFAEVLRRLEQLELWSKNGRPQVYWLAGFFNPQGFLTGVRQEITRGHKADNWALDKVETRTEVTKFEKLDFPERPPEVYEKGAVYIYGMYLEGAGWDKGKQKLRESKAGDLFVELPVLQVYAISTEAGKERQKDAGGDHGRQKKPNKYRCAVYKYKKRTDNEWIFDVDLNCDEQDWHWKLRGTALLCNTD